MSDDRKTPPSAETHDHHVPTHQRTLDEPSNVSKRKKLSTGATVGIAISAAVHMALFAYLYRQRFEMNQMEYNDDAVDVELIAPPPLQPRVSVVPTDAPPPPITLAMKPQEVYVEQPNTVVAPNVPPAPPAPPPAPPPPPPAPPVITRPDWLSRPSGEDLARFYPDRAREEGVSGRATISCTVTARGGLTGCSVVSETPSGSGFGAATLRAAGRFRMKPKTENGQPVEGGTVKVPLVWQLGE